MKPLINKQIILAVSGSIAAYKAPDIIRHLQKLGAKVRVVLTKNGSKFITELSLQTISKNKVHHSLWDKEAELAMGHIELAKWADAIIVAPASANIIASISAGKADDLLLNVILASNCHILVAPAMNQQMYAAKALKSNLANLKKRGIKIIYPEYGEQACSDIGKGRLANYTKIGTHLTQIFKSTKLTGKQVLITLGATIEAIDPVRYLSNHSSGKMGLALASVCIDYGAKVTVVHGHISAPLVYKTKNFAVNSAAEMYKTVMEHINQQDIFIACAAVSDYRAKKVSANKIKSNNETLTLELVKNKDILAKVSSLKTKPICVGFAAEDKDLIKNARKKLKNKGCDAIILNNISKPDIAFNSDNNEVVFIDDKSQITIAKNSKQKISQKIIDILLKKFF